MTINDLLQKNKPLDSIHSGKRCFIIGNGPSLADQDIVRLKDEITIVVSSFYRHPEARTIHPKYWVLADPSFWAKPDKYFMPTLNAAMDKNVHVKLFVPSGGADFFLNINTGPLIDLHFFHYDPSKSIDSQIDFSSGIPPFGQNVVAICLMLAFYLGCNPIYFIGCDHDFMIVTEEQYKKLEIKHFYENPAEYKEQLSMKWDQFCAAKNRMNFEYDQLRKYASLWGFNVYNATAGGYFDTFPHIGYESLFVDGGLTARQNMSGSRTPAINCAEGALKLMQQGHTHSALELLSVALRQNSNTKTKTYGIEYLMAICLARLNRFQEALIFARQDKLCSPSNTDTIDRLIVELENRCSIEKLIGSIPEDKHTPEGSIRS